MPMKRAAIPRDRSSRKRPNAQASASDTGERVVSSDELRRRLLLRTRLPK